MTVIALVLGSIFGFFSAVTGWAVFDMSAFSAFSLYIGSSLGLGMLAVVGQMVCCMQSGARQSAMA